MRNPLPLLFSLGLLASFYSASAEAPWLANKPPVPDLTQGGVPDQSHDWTLGATGARGWVWGWKCQTTDARQILITSVAKGSPADGVLQPKDVLTGINGQPFTEDARVAFAKAVTAAEKDPGGVLNVVRWRGGAVENVQLKLAVLGEYAATAPFGCPKSKRIFELGCEAIARQGLKDPKGNLRVCIENDMNALALLASGRAEYRPLLAIYAQAVADSTPGGWETWHYAYRTIFLAEYILATKDSAPQEGLRRLSLDIARGASPVGTWGHKFMLPGATFLAGYGCMNQPGIPLTLALVLAREAGVKEPDLEKTIAKSRAFLRQWVNKGAIPYGDHEPWPWHDDNGKTSSAAVLFDLLGDREAAAFYSRMGTAAYAEREEGHTGNFFNILWALPGVSRCGPAATAAYFKETSWYYDLARGWDGRCEYPGIPGKGKSAYSGWDCSGAFLLGYALPLKSLYMTGRKPGVAPVLSAKEADETIAAGRDFNFWVMLSDEKQCYAGRSNEALMSGLSSWSPAVRRRSAQALGLREGNFLPQILKLLSSADRNTRYGACEALANLGPKADSAAPQIRALLKNKDPWMRMLAAQALPWMGEEARLAAVPELLRAVLLKDPEDRRQRFVGEAAKALFKVTPGKREPLPILAKSLNGVDRWLLHGTIRQVIGNEDGLIRGLAAGVYPLLTLEDTKALLPEITDAVRTVPVSGEMFRYGVRFAGLDLLAQHRIREGMDLCVDLMNEFQWGRKMDRCLGALGKYGGAAKEVLPRVRETQQTMEGMLKATEAKGWKDEELKKDIQAVAKLVAKIEADKNAPPVVGVEEFTGRPSAPFNKVQDAEKAVLKLFPEIGTSGSKWNKSFLDRQKKLKQTDPDAMRDPNWPMQLALALAAEAGK